MKTNLSAFTIAFACLSLLAALATAQEPEKSEIVWEEVDSSEFAVRLTAANAAGEKWAANPESIILEYAGPFILESGEKLGRSRIIRIHTKEQETPKTLFVVLFDDGLYDDSVKTSRKRLALTRGKDGKWKVRKAFSSFEKWKPLP